MGLDYGVGWGGVSVLVCACPHACACVGFAGGRAPTHVQASVCAGPGKIVRRLWRRGAGRRGVCGAGGFRGRVGKGAGG